MGFALYDHRAGPTSEEASVQDNIDRLAMFIRRTLMKCEKMRCTLKIGAARMDPKQQEIMAEAMDLWVARPATPGADGSMRRFCWPKIVMPTANIPEKYHTYFWTPNGERIPIETVQRYQNFKVVPFVEVEDVFVNKAMRSLQLKLRECIVYPPAERLSVRTSVCFPGRLCTSNQAAAQQPALPVTAILPDPEEEGSEVVVPPVANLEEESLGKDAVTESVAVEPVVVEPAAVEPVGSPARKRARKMKSDAPPPPE